MQERRWFIPRGRVVLGAVVLVLVYVAYFRSFRGHVVASWEDVDDWRLPAAMAAVTTLFTYLTLLAIGVALQAVGERRRTGAFRRGAPYRDAEFAAVEGEVRAVGKTLVAPFSGRKCVAYEYDVWMGEGSVPGRRRNPDAGVGWAGIAGVALAPTAIEGPEGAVRLMGWTPLQSHFRAEWFEGKTEGVNGRLKALIKSRKFEMMTGVKGFRLIGRLFDLQSDDDGALRQDWCLDEAVLLAPRTVLISERVVEEGDRVGASGLWSEERRGLYGQVGRVGLELWPGNLDDRRRRLLLQPMGRLAFMLLMCAGVHGMVALVWKSDEEVEAVRAQQAAEKAATSFQDVIWKDVEATRGALRSGVSVEQRDHYDNTLLMEAAHQHDARWVKMLLEEGADVHAENPRWGTALAQALRSSLRGRDEVIALLKAAGARDFRVSAENGHPVPPGGGAFRGVIGRWYGSIEKSDLPALNAQFVTADLDSIDWDLWRRVRPLSIETVQGYANQEAATLTVRGRDPDGRLRAWAYHLVRRPPENQDWRILYEWQLD